MALARLVREFAIEIFVHDWSDAPYRADRAGHRREHDTGWEHMPRLDDAQTEVVRLNVMWVTGQVLGHAGLLRQDDIYEFAEACGCNTKTPSGKPQSGHIRAGFRIRDGHFQAPSGLFVSVSKDERSYMWDDGPWDEIDFADRKVVSVETAWMIVSAWLKRRGVKKTLSLDSFVAYAANGHIPEAFPNKGAPSVGLAGSPSGWFVPIGPLREWFCGYYERNYSEHAFGP